MQFQQQKTNVNNSVFVDIEILDAIKKITDGKEKENKENFSE